jgi:hypothetical protein
MTPALEVAQFMLDELNKSTCLYQDTIVYDIDKKFGPGFTSLNAPGNPSINKDVLAAFNKLTPDVVWVRGERLWRQREPFDQPGRLQ